MKPINTHNFKQGLKNEIEIIDVENIFRHSNEKLKTNHRLNFHGIIWFQSGSPTHMVDFNPVYIKPNTLLFLRKDTVHSFDTETPFKAKAIVFTDNFIYGEKSNLEILKRSLIFNDLYSIPIISIQNDLKLFTNIFNLINSELENRKDQFQENILRYNLLNFILNSERLINNQNDIPLREDAHFDLVVSFKNAIEKYFQKSRSVKFYSTELFSNPKKLARATNLVLGSTPKQMIEQQVILESKRLLVYTKDSIKEISYKIGFDEPTNFNKFFKKHTSFTPISFRENNKVE